jgi:hypothetical protein
MSETEAAARAVIVEVAKLDIKPGQALAMMCPDDWSVDQVRAFTEYLEALDPLPGVKLLCLPKCELAVVSPPEGFGT